MRLTSAPKTSASLVSVRQPHGLCSAHLGRSTGSNQRQWRCFGGALAVLWQCLKCIDKLQDLHTCLKVTNYNVFIIERVENSRQHSEDPKALRVHSLSLTQVCCGPNSVRGSSRSTRHALQASPCACHSPLFARAQTQ